MTLRRRVEAACAFGLRQPGATYLPTGAVGRYGRSEASVMAGLLHDFGVTDDHIILEESGVDTLSSVRAVAALLRGHSGLVYAATSAYHLPRCLILLRLARVPARACPPPAYPAAADFKRRWLWRLREGLALPWDVFLMLLLRLYGRI